MSISSQPLSESAISAHSGAQSTTKTRPPPKRQYVAKADFVTAPEPR